MTAGISLGILFILISSVPIFILFTLFHLKQLKCRETIQHPVMKGFCYGLCITIPLLIYIYHDVNNSGEGGFGLIVIAPFLFISSIVPGFIIGFIYKKRNDRIKNQTPLSI